MIKDYWTEEEMEEIIMDSADYESWKKTIVIERIK